MKQITSGVHPKTKEVYNVEDIVCIYQGRFGHNNIIIIKSMWIENEGLPTERILVSEDERCLGTGLYAVKEKLTPKKVKEINQAKQLARQYS